MTELPPDDPNDEGTLVERTRKTNILDFVSPKKSEESVLPQDDGLFKPWRLVRSIGSIPPELDLRFKNGQSRSLALSDQKGVWHDGDLIVIRFIEEMVFYVILKGERIGELANGLKARVVYQISSIDEDKAQLVERDPRYEGKNVFSIRIVRRPWDPAEPCEYDRYFEDMAD